jgi:thymidylate kinase
MGLLCARLSRAGAEVEQLKIPDYEGPLGSCLRYGLNDKDFDKYALQMLFSAERLRLRPSIMHSLERGAIIVAERYKWSSCVYPRARGLDPVWAGGLETPLPDPNCTILLRIAPELSFKRTGGRDLLERDIEMLRRCCEYYDELARSNMSWVIIDGNDAVTNVHERVWAACRGLIGDMA